MSRPRPSGTAGADRWVVRYPLARSPRLDLDGFAASARPHPEPGRRLLNAGLPPELVPRLVKLGLVQATRDSAGRLWFTRAELVTVARIQRLRTGLSLNWAAIGLVLDLLDRIDVLERDLRARPRPPAKEGALDLTRLTQKSQEALHDAQTKALRFGHTEVDGEHLLLALLDQPDGLAPRLLE